MKKHNLKKLVLLGVAGAAFSANPIAAAWGDDDSNSNTNSPATTLPLKKKKWSSDTSSSNPSSSTSGDTSSSNYNNYNNNNNNPRGGYIANSDTDMPAHSDMRPTPYSSAHPFENKYSNDSDTPSDNSNMKNSVYSRSSQNNDDQNMRANRGSNRWQGKPMPSNDNTPDQLADAYDSTQASDPNENNPRRPTRPTPQPPQRISNPKQPWLKGGSCGAGKCSGS